MGYPASAYRGGERRGPGSQRPGSPTPYRPQTRPPFANDNAPPAANDNNPRMQSQRWAPRIPRALRPFQFAFRRLLWPVTALDLAGQAGILDGLLNFAFGQRLHAPGYTLSKDCGPGSGMTTGLGFPYCGNFFLSQTPSQALASRPQVFWTWLPTLNPSVWKAGQEWTRVDVIGDNPAYLPRIVPFAPPRPGPGYWPQLDPLPYPGLRPMPRPVTPPYRALPRLPVNPLPEGPSRGNDPTPTTSRDPRRRQSWRFQPGERPEDRDDPNTRPRPRPRRARKRKKERKFHVYQNRYVRIARSVYNVVSEYDDFLDALYTALPKKIIAQNGGYSAPPQRKSMTVYRYFHMVDMKQALINLGINQVEDFVIGKVAKGAIPTNERMGRPVGIQFGPAL